MRGSRVVVELYCRGCGSGGPIGKVWRIGSGGYCRTEHVLTAEGLQDRQIDVASGGLVLTTTWHDSTARRRDRIGTGASHQTELPVVPSSSLFVTCAHHGYTELSEAEIEAWAEEAARQRSGILRRGLPQPR